MSTGDLFTLFSGQSGTADSFQVQVQKTASARQIRLQTVMQGTITYANEVNGQGDRLRQTVDVPPTTSW